MSAHQRQVVLGCLCRGMWLWPPNVAEAAFEYKRTNNVCSTYLYHQQRLHGARCHILPTWRRDPVPLRALTAQAMRPRAPDVLQLTHCRIHLQRDLLSSCTPTGRPTSTSRSKHQLEMDGGDQRVPPPADQHQVDFCFVEEPHGVGEHGRHARKPRRWQPLLLQTKVASNTNPSTKSLALYRAVDGHAQELPIAAAHRQLALRSRPTS